MKAIFTGEVKDGQLNKKTFEALLQYLASLKGKISIVVEKGKRTTLQNNFYWLYLGIIAHETGDDQNSLHEYFKRKYLPPQFITALGKTIKIPASTTDLDKHDFSNYLERISAETGIPVPETYNN